MGQPSRERAGRETRQRLSVSGPLLWVLLADTAYTCTRVRASLRLVFRFDWFL
jgi:hypothetical protein